MITGMPFALIRFLTPWTGAPGSCRSPIAWSLVDAHGAPRAVVVDAGCHPPDDLVGERDRYEPRSRFLTGTHPMQILRLRR